MTAIPRVSPPSLPSLRVWIPRATPISAKTRQATGNENIWCRNITSGCGEMPASTFLASSCRRSAMVISGRPREGMMSPLPKTVLSGDSETDIVPDAVSYTPASPPGMTRHGLTRQDDHDLTPGLVLLEESHGRQGDGRRPVRLTRVGEHHAEPTASGPEFPNVQRLAWKTLVEHARLDVVLAHLPPATGTSRPEIAGWHRAPA